MDTRRGFFNGRVPRILLGLNNFIILASSIILTGILSYFLHWGYRGTHVTYNEVIAVVTLFLYLFAMVFPAIKRYHGYMLPLNLVLSYLWLTSLIFTSQDYSGGRCRRSYYYTRSNRCSLKHTVQAFEIIGFSFLFFNVVLEALMWASHHRTRVSTDTEKAPALTTTAPVAGATGGVAPTAV